MSGIKEVSGRNKVQTKILGNAGPVPNRCPISDIHESPYFLKDLNDAVAVVEPGVSPDRFDGGTDSILLFWRETCSAKNKAREKEQGLAGITGLEGLQDS